MSSSIPAFYTEAINERKRLNEQVRSDREQASRFLSRIDKLLNELEEAAAKGTSSEPSIH